MPKVLMSITLETENRDDHWACFVPELGFTVYGETRIAAEHEVNHALEALLGSFYGDLDAIARYLERYDVAHSIQDDPELDQGNPSIATRQVQIEVPIAV